MPGYGWPECDVCLEDRLTADAVPAGCTVVCRGAALTFIDALLTLTEGRGGRFDENGYHRSGGEPARCQERYPDFIDHIVLDPRAASRFVAGSFEQFDYGVSEAEHPSDHCPIAIRVGQ